MKRYTISWLGHREIFCKLTVVCALVSLQACDRQNEGERSFSELQFDFGALQPLSLFFLTNDQLSDHAELSDEGALKVEAWYGEVPERRAYLFKVAGEQPEIQVNWGSAFSDLNIRQLKVQIKNSPQLRPSSQQHDQPSKTKYSLRVGVRDLDACLSLGWRADECLGSKPLSALIDRSVVIFLHVGAASAASVLSGAESNPPQEAPAFLKITEPYTPLQRQIRLRLDELNTSSFGPMMAHQALDDLITSDLTSQAPMGSGRFPRWQHRPLQIKTLTDLSAWSDVKNCLDQQPAYRQRLVDISKAFARSPNKQRDQSIKINKMIAEHQKWGQYCSTSNGIVQESTLHTLNIAQREVLQHVLRLSREAWLSDQGQQRPLISARSYEDYASNIEVKGMSAADPASYSCHIEGSLYEDHQAYVAEAIGRLPPLMQSSLEAASIHLNGEGYQDCKRRQRDAGRGIEESVTGKYCWEMRWASSQASPKLHIYFDESAQIIRRHLIARIIYVWWEVFIDRVMGASLLRFVSLDASLRTLSDLHLWQQYFTLRQLRQRISEAFIDDLQQAGLLEGLRSTLSYGFGTPSLRRESSLFNALTAFVMSQEFCSDASRRLFDLNHFSRTRAQIWQLRLVMGDS